MSARSPYSPRSNPRSPWAHLDVSNQHASPLSRENSLRRGSGTYWEVRVWLHVGCRPTNVLIVHATRIQAEDLLHRSTSGDVFARSPGGVSPVVGAGDDDDDGLQDLLSGSVYHGNGTGPLPQEELDIASSPKPSLFKQLSSSKLGQLLRKKKRRREKEQLQADAAAADFKSNGSSHSPRRAPRKGSGSAATLTLPSSAYDPTNPYSPTSPFPPRGGYVLYTRRWFVLGTHGRCFLGSSLVVVFRLCSDVPLSCLCSSVLRSSFHEPRDLLHIRACQPPCRCTCNLICVAHHC